MASPEAVRLFTQIYAKVDAQVRDIVKSMLPDVDFAAQDDGSVVANDHRIVNFQGAGVTVSDDPAMRRVNVLVPGAPVVTSQSVFVSAPGSEQAYDNGTSGTGPTGWYTAAYNHFGTGWTASVADTSGIAGMPTPPSSSSYVTKSSAVQPSNERFLFWRTFTLPSNTVISANLLIVQDNFLEHLYINGTAVGADATANGVIQTLSISPSMFIPGAANGLAIQVRNEVAGASNVMRMAYRLEVNFGAGGTDSQYELVARKGVANGYAGLDASTHVPTAQLGSGTASSTTYLRGDSSWAAAGGGSSPLTTKGDVYVYGSSDTRLPVGSNNQVLTADSAQSTGLKWAAAASGSLLLFQTTLASAAATISTGTLASTARDLRIVVIGRGTASASNIQVLLQFNGDTAANYDFIEAQAVGVSNVNTTNSAVGQTSIRLGYLTAGTSPSGVPGIILAEIPAYTETTFGKVLLARDTIKVGTGVAGLVWDSHTGYWTGSAAITSILLTASSGNFAIGTSVRVYGDV